MRVNPMLAGCKSPGEVVVAVVVLEVVAGDLVEAEVLAEAGE